MPAPSYLTPQVTGSLSETEANIIQLIQSEGDAARYRTTISIDVVLALAAVRAAHRERRENFSNLLTAALSEYTEARGPLPPELVEFMGMVQAARAENPQVLPVLKATLKRTLRQPRSAA